MGYDRFLWQVLEISSLIKKKKIGQSRIQGEVAVKERISEEVKSVFIAVLGVSLSLSLHSPLPYPLSVSEV